MHTADPASPALPYHEIGRGRLGLRVRSGDRPGREILLARGTHLLGSAAECGLCFAADGLRPFHCLIVHGAARTVARRIVGPARRNARRFEETLLAPGDRLRLGGLELEAVVLADKAAEQAPAPAGRTEPQAPHDPRAAAQAAGALDWVQRQIEDLAAVEGRLRPRPSRGARRPAARRRLPARLRRLARRLERRQQEARRLVLALESRGRTCAAELSRHVQRLASLERELRRGVPSRAGQSAAEGERLAAELAAQRADLEAELRRRHETAWTDLDRARADWETLRAQLDGWSNRHSVLVDRVAHSEACRRAAVADAERRLEHFAARLDELTPTGSASRSAADALRGELQAATTNAEGRTADLEVRLSQLAATLRGHQQAQADQARRAEQQQQRLAELARRQELTHGDQAQRQQAHDRLLDALAQRAAILERRVDDLVAQQHAREAARAAEGDPAADVRHPLDQRLAELRAEREALEDERRQARAERALARLVEPLCPGAPDDAAPMSGAATEPRASGGPASPADVTKRAAPPLGDDPPARHAAEPTAIAAAAHEPGALSDAPPRRGSQPSAQELFARIGLAVTRDEAAEPQRVGVGSAWPLSGGPVRDFAVRELEIGPATEAAVAPPARPAAASGPARRHAETEEESIEQYMARLMARVRPVATSEGEAPPSGTVNKPPALRVGEPETGEPAAGEAGPGAAGRRAAERIKPPELFTDLNALRELANLNARNAIDAHSRQRLTRSMHGKLLFTVVALAIALALVFQSTSHRALLYSGLAISLTVAAVWGVQWLLLWRRLARPDGAAGTTPPVAAPPASGVSAFTGADPACRATPPATAPEALEHSADEAP